VARPSAWRRVELSRAKHPSLAGHAKLSRRLAALLPCYGYDEQQFCACDAAPADVVAQRRAGFDRLASEIGSRAPVSIKFSDSLVGGVSDVQFTDAYRVPFQFRDYVREFCVPPPSSTSRASSSCAISTAAGLTASRARTA
jgi:glutamate-1-semialdehyde 2,1-aminomutase